MVSSKFSQRRNPLKVPAVCRKPTPAGGAPPIGDPNPAEHMLCWYHVDCKWYIFDYQADGCVDLYRYNPTSWQSPLPKPQNGEWAFFYWWPAQWKFYVQVQHFEGGILKWSVARDWWPGLHEGNFNTGQFTFNYPTFWTGEKIGRVFNL